MLSSAVSSGTAQAGIFFENQGIGNGRGDLYFAIDNTADASDADISDIAMTIDNTGNVGIGETNPGTLLDLSSTNPYLTLHNTARNTPISRKVEHHWFRRIRGLSLGNGIVFRPYDFVLRDVKAVPGVGK